MEFILKIIIYIVFTTLFFNLSLSADDKYSNLFYVGAGTHPGAGVPGVINSAKVVEKLIYS